MKKRHFTIVVIPRRTGAIRKIKVPVSLFLICTALFLALLSGWAYMIIDYFNSRQKIVGYPETQVFYEDQSTKINKFYQKYETVDLHFENLHALNYKLKQMTRITEDTKKESNWGKNQKQKKVIELAVKSSILDTITSELPEIDTELKYEQEIRFENLSKFYNEQKNPLSYIPTGRPVKGYLVSEYGLSNDPFTGEIKPEYGINITTPNFHPIYSPADGIIFSIERNDELGNQLIMDHGNGFMTRYGHIAKFEVSVGDIVRKGKIIAQAGNTGRTTGSRLHYEIMINGVPQNPKNYLSDVFGF